jgi:hypothetical protein
MKNLFCPICGTKVASLSLKEIENDDGILSCPNCVWSISSALLRYDFIKNQNISSELAEAFGLIKCIYCNNNIDTVYAKYCTHCGKKL